MAMDGEQEVKEQDVENGSRIKYCPIMTAGHVSSTGWGTTQVRVACMGKMCGIWNETTKECGLISFATRIESK